MKIHLPECLSFVSQLTIYVQPEQVHTAEYAADVTKIVFDYFEEYFDMSYSLPKLGEKMLSSPHFKLPLFYLS